MYRFDFVPESERILHYAASDLCIFPSTYEPFGIVSLEAMAMEKPVIVGARGVVGFRELSCQLGRRPMWHTRQRGRPSRHRLGHKRDPAEP